jgi:hypothetical protein
MVCTVLRKRIVLENVFALQFCETVRVSTAALNKPTKTSWKGLEETILSSKEHLPTLRQLERQLHQFFFIFFKLEKKSAIEVNTVRIFANLQNILQVNSNPKCNSRNLCRNSILKNEFYKG